MSSSWTDGSYRTPPPPRFLSVDRGSLVRLALVLSFGAAALAAPLLGTTSAQFTDSTQIGVTFTVPPADVEIVPPAAP